MILARLSGTSIANAHPDYQVYRMDNDDVDYELLGKIIECVQETFEFGANAFKDLSLSTDLNRQLGIEGDDANELMPEFFQRFSVDLGNYDAYRYFVPEGYDLLSFRRGQDRRGKIPIKLGMLYLAAITKTWDPTLLEQVHYSNIPLYQRKADIPLTGYEMQHQPQNKDSP